MSLGRISLKPGRISVGLIMRSKSHSSQSQIQHIPNPAIPNRSISQFQQFPMTPIPNHNNIPNYSNFLPQQFPKQNLISAIPNPSNAPIHQILPQMGRCPLQTQKCTFYIRDHSKMHESDDSPKFLQNSKP